MTFEEAKNDKLKLQQVIKEKWTNLLEPEEPVEDTTSFFDIGGNSLTAGIIFADIEQQLGIKIAISEIYDCENADLLSDRIIALLEGQA
ncbi:MAG: acyl carrier protein [Ruminococcus sp.]|nr:acyl carrier protein [Ruminococcus sp.]